MTSRMIRSAALAAALALAMANGVAAATVQIDAHFTQEFGGRNGELAPCPNDELICGEGLVAGYGRASDAFLFGPNDEFLHTFTLADGSTLTVQLELADAFTPGASGEAPGATASFGNPVTFVFDAFDADGTGVFAGATGSGTITLNVAGNVQQILVELEIDLP